MFFNLFNRDTADWEKQATFIAKLPGVEHVEVLLEETGLQKQELQTVKKLLKPYRIIMHAPFMDLTLLSAHKEIVEASRVVFAKAVAIGKYLRAELLTLHAERYPHFWTEEHARKQLISSVERLAKRASFPIAIENLSVTKTLQIAYPATPAAIFSLATHLPHNARLTIDTGHLLKDDFNVTDVLRRVHGVVGNIHLHDGKKEKSHLQLGTGELNLVQFLRFLEKVQYGGFLTLEVVGEKEIVNSWRLLRNKTHKTETVKQGLKQGL